MPPASPPEETAPLLYLRLGSTPDYQVISEACQALGLDPQEVLRDPVAAMPLVARCNLSQGLDFLRMVCPACAMPHLDHCQSEDQARMIVTVIFAVFINQVRRQTRGCALLVEEPASGALQG